MRANATLARGGIKPLELINPERGAFQFIAIHGPAGANAKLPWRQVSRLP
jgi:hypothetical protein